jgi:hypothetical protein
MNQGVLKGVVPKLHLDIHACPVFLEEEGRSKGATSVN